jgi:hypothetical protein
MYGRKHLLGAAAWPGALLQSQGVQLNTFNTPRTRLIFVAFNVIFLLIIWTILPHHAQNTIIDQTNAATHKVHSDRQSTTGWSTKKDDRLIANGTLGFEKIYTIGLPDRFDKRDAIELAAAVTDLQLTWVDGVPGNQISPKSVPPTFKLPGVLPGVVGCWRGHMNVIQKIVKEGISSALILEDDADWDIHIVQQMQQFSAATKDLLSQGGPKKKRELPTNSPYGEGWDILWIGHCNAWQANSYSMRRAIIRDDQTVPPNMGMDEILPGFAPGIGWDVESWTNITCSAHKGRDPPGKVCDSPRLAPDERLVLERTKPVCTAGYAVSYEGARKMLARLGGISLQDMYAPLDQGMGNICAGYTDLPGEQTRCLTPSPPYIRGHKPRGPLSGDSDIRKTGANGEKRDVGWSQGLMWSTRLNANSIVSGVDFELESQYVRDGKDGKGAWRYRKATEYRSFTEDTEVKKWNWF